MADDKKTCFVVMGFGEKTDYKTSRVLDMNKTYRHIIKKAVEDAGLVCVRADEIAHSGTIDAPMYEMLLDADLVVADLSTSNLNAAYELGIRHALKPSTTIIIAEDKFDAPFDVNHITVRKYRHDGKSLDIDVVEEFRAKLAQAIREIMVNGRIDSPVYTFLPLDAPSRRKAVEALKAAVADTPPAAAAAPAASLAELMDKARTYKASGKYAIAKDYLQEARAVAPNEVYVVQQLALVTYKSKQPSEAEALKEACEILETLNPLHSNDAETLGLWGAIHKRLYTVSQDKAMLDKAVYAYEKGYRLLSDYYNGINWAYLLNVRSAACSDRAEAITDFVLARRTRADVLALCMARLPDAARQQDLLARKGDKNCLDQRAECYWLLASAAEAALGLGDEAQCATLLAQAAPFADEAFMLPSTNEQLDKLRGLLAETPLRWVSTA